MIFRVLQKSGIALKENGQTAYNYEELSNACKFLFSNIPYIQIIRPLLSLDLLDIKDFNSRLKQLKAELKKTEGKIERDRIRAKIGEIEVAIRNWKRLKIGQLVNKYGVTKKMILYHKCCVKTFQI